MLGHAHFELIHHDIVNSLYIEVDEIYHLGMLVDILYIQVKIYSSVSRINSLGTISPSDGGILFLNGHRYSSVRFGVYSSLLYSTSLEKYQ